MYNIILCNCELQDDGASVFQSPCDSTKDMWTASKPQERIYSGEFAFI